MLSLTVGSRLRQGLHSSPGSVSTSGQRLCLQASRPSRYALSGSAPGYTFLLGPPLQTRSASTASSSHSTSAPPATSKGTPSMVWTGTPINETATLASLLMATVFRKYTVVISSFPVNSVLGRWRDVILGTCLTSTCENTMSRTPSLSIQWTAQEFPGSFSVFAMSKRRSKRLFGTPAFSTTAELRGPSFAALGLRDISLPFVFFFSSKFSSVRSHLCGLAVQAAVVSVLGSMLSRCRMVDAAVGRCFGHMISFNLTGRLAQTTQVPDAEHGSPSLTCSLSVSYCSPLGNRLYQGVYRANPEDTYRSASENIANIR
ncbi:hypothetical protein MRX96_038372 [Rhipicephalus microplus]